MKSISLDAHIALASKLAEDFEKLSRDQIDRLPNKLTYKIASREEPVAVLRSARRAAFEELQPTEPLKKFAFDTRKYDQETTRNPRSNLQTWLRSDQYIDDDTQQKIEIFGKMLKPLEELKTIFGSQPEWHESYVRTLYDHVTRILRVKEADLNIFRPQIAYLEQLMFARYRLSMDELASIEEADFKEAILKKDEALLKRGAYLQMTNSTDLQKASQVAKGEGHVISSENQAVVRGGSQPVTQDSIVNAIFGNNGFRREGERTVERTITITISDKVLD